MAESGFSNDPRREVELIHRLLETADSGPTTSIDSYDASTILAMFHDAEYRQRVLAAADTGHLSH